MPRRGCAGYGIQSKDDYWSPPRPPSGHLTRSGAGKELKAICDDLGLVGVSTHSFRRSLATVLHSNGAPLKAIASITGHKSLDSLQRYIDITPEDFVEAISTGRQPRVDGAEGRKSVEIILALYEAAKTGQSQRLR